MSTMKVRDLIDYLQQLNPDAEVVQSEQDFTGVGEVVILDHVFQEVQE